MEKLEKIKEKIEKSDKLTDEQKSSSFELIKEWAVEDKAFGILYEKLMEISEEIEPILIELGLV
jgi:hypothetical protein